MTDVANLLARLSRLGWRLAVAESCTGGGLGFRLTEIAGASRVFLGGVIAYDNAIKTRILGVNSSTLETYGAVSELAALEMAQGVRDLFQCDLGIAITGIAGPDGAEKKPLGHVCFALAHRNWQNTSMQDFGDLGRPLIRARAIDHALELIETALQRT